MNGLVRLSANGEATMPDSAPRQAAGGRLHPQVALWLVRGALGTTIAGIAFALLPVKDARPALSQTATLAQAVQTGIPPLLASVQTGQPQEALTTAVISPMAQGMPLQNSIQSDPPQGSVLRLAEQPAPRTRSAKPSRIRDRYRAHRSPSRPLAVLARGAKRTVRTVGGTLRRLF